MGNDASAGDESFTSGLLEYPHYTRPAELRDWTVPEMLRSGDHGRIARWRHAQALARTRAQRPDLMAARGGLTADEEGLLETLGWAILATTRESLLRSRPRHEPHRHRRSRQPARRHPGLRTGDTVKVHVRVVEGNRERVQVFQGAVIRRQGSGVRETFTVRKVSFGVGVERTFPVHSPILARIEVVTMGDVRRAKLYYLRDLTGKAAKIKEKRTAR